jgi:uncharacterized protein with PQ loop repeat
VIELVGYLASLGAIAMWLPQVVRTLRHRHDRAYLHAISLGGFGMGIAFNALLIVYGTMTHAIPVIAAGGVNIVCSMLIVGLKVQAR